MGMVPLALADTGDQRVNVDACLDFMVGLVKREAVLRVAVRVMVITGKSWAQLNARNICG